MSPITEDRMEIETIKQTLVAKAAECLEHQAETKETQCLLLDPESGIVVKMARLETNMVAQKEVLDDIKDGQKWIIRGLIGILLAVIGWGAGLWVVSQNSNHADNAQPTYSITQNK